MKLIDRLKRFHQATLYSWQGIQKAYRGETAFREEVFAAAIMIPLACWLDVAPVERAVMIAVVLLVLIVEILNSAIEAVVDRIGAEHHELSGQAKDMGSAAVLFSLFIVIASWSSILVPRYLPEIF